MSANVTKFYKFGLVCIRGNRLLLCEPYAYSDLILPGGTREDEETFAENLVREVAEELGEEAILHLDSLHYLGNFSDVAAGRTYRLVEIEAYLGSLEGKLIASSEIKKLHWFGPQDDRERLSPIIKNKILPFLLRKGYMS